MMVLCAIEDRSRELFPPMGPAAQCGTLQLDSRCWYRNYNLANTAQQRGCLGFGNRIKETMPFAAPAPLPGCRSYMCTLLRSFCLSFYGPFREDLYSVHDSLAQSTRHRRKTH